MIMESGTAAEIGEESENMRTCGEKHAFLWITSPQAVDRSKEPVDRIKIMVDRSDLIVDKRPAIVDSFIKTVENSSFLGDKL
jgi:hypothetical protein